MASALTGLYKIDGLDLWDNFTVSVESGTEAFLQFPEVKDRLSEDWADENGIDIEYDTPNYVKSRDITINFFILTYSEDEFWTKWDAFRMLLLSSGLHLFYINRFSRSFGILYKSASDINLTNKTLENGAKIKFSITFTEINPASTTKYLNMITSNKDFVIDDKKAYFQIVQSN